MECEAQRGSNWSCFVCCGFPRCRLPWGIGDRHGRGTGCGRPGEYGSRCHRPRDSGCALPNLVRELRVAELRHHNDQDRAVLRDGGADRDRGGPGWSAGDHQRVVVGDSARHLAAGPTCRGSSGLVLRRPNARGPGLVDGRGWCESSRVELRWRLDNLERANEPNGLLEDDPGRHHRAAPDCTASSRHGLSRAHKCPCDHPGRAPS